MVHKDWARCGDCDDSIENYPDVFDTIIIGAGPAGMTAAVYAARRKMKILLICGKVGGQMQWSSDIQNYTGVAQATGPELTKLFFDHVKKVDDDNDHFDLWLREKETVENISSKKDVFFVQTNTKQKFRSRTIVVTTGKIPRLLHIPGEDIAMKGNGLSFCATCDAPLYKDKKMVVIGGGNSAMDVALQLSKFTDDITIMTDLDHLIGEAVLMEKVEQHPAISVKFEVKTNEILLDKKVQVRGVLISEGGGKPHEFKCEGIFEEVGQVPATDFLKGVVKLNDRNEIVVNRRCQTNVPGIFAGGDCTDQAHKQVIVAAGEGAIAALEAHEYLLRQ